MQESLTQRINSIDCADDNLVNDMLKRMSGNCDIDPRGYSGEIFYIEVEKGYEKVALKLRNALKNVDYPFDVHRKETGNCLFTVYGDVNSWVEMLKNSRSPILDLIDTSTLLN
jgi:hypothetical protein